jgi:hypothetical protein
MEKNTGNQFFGSLYQRCPLHEAHCSGHIGYQFLAGRALRRVRFKRNFVFGTQGAVYVVAKQFVDLATKQPIGKFVLICLLKPKVMFQISSLRHI